jgi:hypothetical protein
MYDVQTLHGFSSCDNPHPKYKRTASLTSSAISVFWSLQFTMTFSKVYTQAPKTIHLEGSSDWQADLATKGYAVVKGAVPKERAADYASRMHAWLEGL